MLEVQLTDLGKKFGKNIIFKGVNLTVSAGARIVIQGSNGSGKSTLLQVISGYMIQDKGAVSWKIIDRKIEAEAIHQHVAIAAPYLEVPEEFTLRELFAFHFEFRKFCTGVSVQDAIAISGLQHSAEKQVRFFSSGMKQRVRLTLALLSESALLLLDEPTSNLDKTGVEWYSLLMEKYGQGRTIIVCSNTQPADYPGFSSFFNIEEHKG